MEFEVEERTMLYKKINTLWIRTDEGKLEYIDMYGDEILDLYIALREYLCGGCEDE